MDNIVPIDHFNLWSFDLNLLVVFDALMRERSVTKAATRLRIQQPAMSHNLSTLRMLLADELFIRVGQVMKPTPRALALSASVRHILEQTRLSGGTPTSSTAVFQTKFPGGRLPQERRAR